MAPIIVTLAVLRFGKLPCDKRTRGRLVIAQGKAPAIVEGGGLQNLIALVDFYVVSSFPASGQVGPKCMNVTKYPVKPGRKVLGYSGPESRREKSRNTGLFLRANRNRSIRFSAAFFSCAPDFFCGFPRPYRRRNNTFSASQRLSEWEAATQFSIIEILRPDLRKEATAPSLAIPTALKCSFPV